jgi:DNA-binding GntR family transcriptional regulator
MNRSNKNRIPDEVLEEIFPKNLGKVSFSDDLYVQLKRLILSGKLKKGQKLSLNKLARDLNTNIPLIRPVFKQLEREGLIISMGRKGSFVA